MKFRLGDVFTVGILPLFSRRDDAPRRSNQFGEERRLGKETYQEILYGMIVLSTAHKELSIGLSTSLNTEEPSYRFSISLRMLSTAQDPKIGIYFLFGHVQVPCLLSSNRNQFIFNEDLFLKFKGSKNLLNQRNQILQGLIKFFKYPTAKIIT